MGPTITASKPPIWFALAAVIIMNGLDAILTIAVVEAGFAQEANPIMAWLLALGPCVFVIAKLTLVSAGAWLLWKLQGKRLARLGSWVVLCTYSSVMVYHTESIRLLIS